MSVAGFVAVVTAACEPLAGSLGGVDFLGGERALAAGLRCTAKLSVQPGLPGGVLDESRKIGICQLFQLFCLFVRKPGLRVDLDDLEPCRESNDRAGDGGGWWEADCMVRKPFDLEMKSLD